MTFVTRNLFFGKILGISIGRVFEALNGSTLLGVDYILIIVCRTRSEERDQLHRPGKA